MLGKSKKTGVLLLISIMKASLRRKNIHSLSSLKRNQGRSGTYWIPLVYRDYFKPNYMSNAFSLSDEIAFA